MKLDERLQIIQRVISPIWVFDIDRVRIVWANARAAELWGAEDEAALLAREFSPALTESVRTRLADVKATLEEGRPVTQQWTFYSSGAAMNLRCDMSAIALDDGRVGMFVQATVINDQVDPELLRGIEAVRHVSAIVTLFDEAFAVLMQNPAGLRAFGPNAEFFAWFVDAEVPRAILREVGAGRVFEAAAEVRTLGGRRWHAVEARRTKDPVTGAVAMLVLQLDVTARREEQRMIEQQRQQILSLSVPILDVGQGALAVPLMGALDETRSAEISARLLPRVVAQRAGSVILDLTGVEALDAAGAGALLRVVRALSLLGTRPILTGIGPGLAERLVGSGAELGPVLTLRSLHEGLELCRRG